MTNARPARLVRPRDQRIAATLLAVLAMTRPAGAQTAEPTFTCGAEVDTSSRYLWFWTKFAEKYNVPTDGPLGPAVVNVALVRKLTSVVGIRPHITFTRLLDRVARRGLETPAVSYGAAVVIGY